MTNHLLAVGFYQDAGDEGAKLGGSVGRGRAICLFDGVISYGRWDVKSARKRACRRDSRWTRIADDTDPLGSIITVAVYEHNRQRRVGLGLGGKAITVVQVRRIATSVYALRITRDVIRTIPAMETLVDAVDGRKGMPVPIADYKLSSCEVCMISARLFRVW